MCILVCGQENLHLPLHRGKAALSGDTEPLPGLPYCRTLLSLSAPYLRKGRAGASSTAGLGGSPEMIPGPGPAVRTKSNSHSPRPPPTRPPLPEEAKTSEEALAVMVPEQVPQPPPPVAGALTHPYPVLPPGQPPNYHLVWTTSLQAVNCAHQETGRTIMSNSLIKLVTARANAFGEN